MLLNLSLQSNTQIAIVPTKVTFLIPTELTTRQPVDQTEERRNGIPLRVAINFVTLKHGALNSHTGRRTIRVFADSMVRTVKDPHLIRNGTTTIDLLQDHSKLQLLVQLSKSTLLRTEVKQSLGLRLSNGLMLNQMEDFQLLQKSNRLLLRIRVNQSMKMVLLELHHLLSEVTLSTNHQEPMKVSLVQMEEITEETKTRPNLERLAKIGDHIVLINITITPMRRNPDTVLRLVIINVETQMVKIQSGVTQLIQLKDGNYVSQFQQLVLGLQLSTKMEQRVTLRLVQFMVLQSHHWQALTPKLQPSHSFSRSTVISFLPDTIQESLREATL